jgi:tetratricopeptide (TPR) repeat protein
VDDDTLREGIAAARAGQRERARDLLMQIVEKNEENVLAWLWLSGVVDSLDDREICLENVLALDPSNDAARKGLAWVRGQRRGSLSTSGEPEAPSPPPQEISASPPRSTKTSVSAAAAVLSEDFARQRPPPAPEPELSPLPLRAEFDDEYQCPYCAAQTAPDDHQCPTCGKELWVKIRRREKRSSWLWIALTLQAASIIWPAFTLLVALFYAARQAGLDNFFRLMPVYLGLPGDLPPQIASAALEVVPRAYILPVVFYVLFSLAVMTGLYLRWKPIFYLYLANALVILGCAVVGMAIGLSLPPEEGGVSQRVGIMCGGGGVIPGLLMFLLVIQIADDFAFKKKRVLLRPDRDATNGPALLDSGLRYARQGMAALAAIHLRRAIAHMPHQIGPHLALVAAYLSLKRYDLAASALEEARRIDPNHPQIEYLTAVLSSQPPAEGPPVVGRLA